MQGIGRGEYPTIDIVDTLVREGQRDLKRPDGGNSSVRGPELEAALVNRDANIIGGQQKSALNGCWVGGMVAGRRKEAVQGGL